MRLKQLFSLCLNSGIKAPSFSIPIQNSKSTYCKVTGNELLETEKYLKRSPKCKIKGNFSSVRPQKSSNTCDTTDLRNTND